jgi:hypothetical protein
MAAAVAPEKLVSVPIPNPFVLPVALGGRRRPGHAPRLAARRQPGGGPGLPGAAVPGRPGVKRQQLCWVAFGAAGAVAGLLAVVLLLTLQDAYGLLPGAWLVALALTLPCVPVTVAVAVLRYQLWGLDRLVSRTVTYALVTGLLVLPYLLILPAAARLGAGAAAGNLAVAAATLAAAAAFFPLRRRVQDGSTGASNGAATTRPRAFRQERAMWPALAYQAVAQSPPGAVGGCWWTLAPGAGWPG